MKKIIRILNNLFKNTKRVLNWIPVILKDRDWDHHFLYVIIHKKLSSMEKFFYSDKCWGKNHKKLAKEIKIARILCERIIENKYLSNALTNYHKKYGEDFDFEFVPIKEIPGYNRLVDNRSKKEKLDFRRASNHSDYMEKQDKDLLFDFMKKNINKWWD